MDFPWDFPCQRLPFEVEDVSAAKELLAEGRRKRQEELANEEKKRCSAKRREISTQRIPLGLGIFTMKITYRLMVND